MTPIVLFGEGLVHLLNYHLILRFPTLSLAGAKASFAASNFWRLTEQLAGIWAGFQNWIYCYILINNLHSHQINSFATQNFLEMLKMYHHDHKTSLISYQQVPLSCMWWCYAASSTIWELVCLWEYFCDVTCSNVSTEVQTCYMSILNGSRYSNLIKTNAKCLVISLIITFSECHTLSQIYGLILIHFILT